MYSGTAQQLFAHYNLWMNEKLYAAAATLTDDDRKADRGAFFGSIHLTLEHVLRGDQSWLRRFRGEPPLGPATISPVYADFDELRAERAACDRYLLEWANALTPEWLARPYRWTAGASDRSFTMPGFAVAAHVFNHQTHHRGQVTTLLFQLGVDPGVTDLPMLPELGALLE